MDGRLVCVNSFNSGKHRSLAFYNYFIFNMDRLPTCLLQRQDKSEDTEVKHRHAQVLTDLIIMMLVFDS